MSGRHSLRLLLDIAMTVLFVCAYACRITGAALHKYIGIGITVLFFTHIAVNRRWFAAVFKGTYSPRRVLITAVNILLTITAVIVISTGITEAFWTPSFLLVENGITIREIHSTSAYWFLPLSGVHLGLHWGMFLKFKNRAVITGARILACLFAAYGIWSFFDRDMFAKLFLGYSFDYWPPERPVIFFFVQTLSIMGIFVFIGYYPMKLIYWLKNRPSKITGEVL
jgi:hypothetical protein